MAIALQTKIQQSSPFRSSVTLATSQALDSCMQPAATMLERREQSFPVIAESCPGQLWQQRAGGRQRSITSSGSPSIVLACGGAAPAGLRPPPLPPVLYTQGPVWDRIPHPRNSGPREGAGPRAGASWRHRTRGRSPAFFLQEAVLWLQGGVFTF